jgi:hypothetical protein
VAGYEPLQISGNQTGLVQNRQEFLLPNDAYPTLENAYVFREQIRRKQGCELLARLRRIYTTQAMGNLDGSGTFTGNLKVVFSLESNSDIQVGTVIVSDGTNTYTDNLLGVLVGSPGGSGTINYSSGAIVITGGAALSALTVSFNYFPNLPVMGLRSRELNNINNEATIAFDTKYAYRFANGWQEFIPGTTWTGTDYNFFWSTNYWVDSGLTNKLFWVTNFSGTSGDPIRYTDGTTWTDFAPIISNGDPTQKLQQCLAILPFRGRLVVFNTLEGPTLGTSKAYFQRIRWSAIGNPLIAYSAGPPVTGSWVDDVQGKGGFLDIPTAENITAVGFVRDNLVVYCERSTWQLRYRGSSVAPFQIERINSELGAESAFSAVQFDTSLVGIGDKGVVECDSFKSDRIDIKIPDLVFYFNSQDNNESRVYGTRNFQKKIAFWSYPYAPSQIEGQKFPNRRLIYNYENDSWAIYKDSFTCYGTYQSQEDARWVDFVETIPENIWQVQNYPWIDFPALFPAIVAGNQQGYVSIVDKQTTNDFTLTIKNITGNSPNVTSIESPNHNLETNQVIQISNIPTGTPFDDLNGGIFGVDVQDVDNFNIYLYDSNSGLFSMPQSNDPGTYIGGGQIAIRDNFRVVSKKFNFIEEGQNIQLGYIDLLVDRTTNGAISLNIYSDYNNNSPINLYPENSVSDLGLPDTFFNTTIETFQTTGISSSKLWRRTFCPVRSNFITIEWTFSNAQMNGEEQENDVQIDSQILWIRRAGKQLVQIE